MVYNPEKYKEKREKVLGIKKRGISFGTIAVIVSLMIISGLSIAIIPNIFSYMAARHLDDAIFKIESDSTLSKDVVVNLKTIDGVKNVVNDKNSTRLVITFDRRIITLSSIKISLEQYDIFATLLNRVNHLQHQRIMKEEEKELEAL